MRSLSTTMNSSRRSLQLEKASEQQQRPSEAKNTYIKLKNNFLNNIYLVAPGLRCGTWYLLFPCNMQDLSSRHVGSSSLTRDKPSHLHWEQGVLATGPPGKFCTLILIWEVQAEGQCH